jgi:uncharacterized membrane protein
MTDPEIQPTKLDDKAAIDSAAEKTSLGVKLRGSFFAGILVTVPIVLTIYLVWGLVHFVDDIIASILPNRWNPNTYLPFDVPGLGLIIFVVAMVLIGAVTASFLGRYFHRRFDRIMNRLPVVRSIYSAIKQIMETVFSQRARAFREAVLVEYPRRDIWTIAFITGETEGEVKHLHEDEIINIYVPTTPNPTSGFLLFVPKRDVIPLGMSVDEALKMVISTGIVTPVDRRPADRRDVKMIPALDAATARNPDKKRS